MINSTEMTQDEVNIFRAIQRSYNLILATLPKDVTKPKIESDKVILLIKREVGILETMATEEHYFHDGILQEIRKLRDLINKL